MGGRTTWFNMLIWVFVVQIIQPFVCNETRAACIKKYTVYVNQTTYNQINDMSTGMQKYGVLFIASGFKLGVTREFNRIQKQGLKNLRSSWKLTQEAYYVTHYLSRHEICVHESFGPRISLLGIHQLGILRSLDYSHRSQASNML